MMALANATRSIPHSMAGSSESVSASLPNTVYQPGVAPSTTEVCTAFLTATSRASPNRRMRPQPLNPPIDRVRATPEAAMLMVSAQNTDSRSKR